MKPRVCPCAAVVKRAGKLKWAASHRRATCRPAHDNSAASKRSSLAGNFRGWPSLWKRDSFGIACGSAELHIVYANVDGYASIAALRQPYFLHENLVRRKPGAVTMVTFLPAGLILTA